MSLALCMVMCRAESQLSASEIERHVRGTWPDVGDVGISHEVSDTIVLESWKGTALISRMPVAIPWSQLEGPCATSFLWKSASSEVRDHSSHLIVSVTVS
jgi:hypothetical protein